MERECQQILQSIDLAECSSNDLDKVVNDLTCLLTKSDKCLARSRYAKHVRPFWNNRLTCLKREKVNRYREWKANGRPRNNLSQFWIAYKNAKRPLDMRLRKFRKSSIKKRSIVFESSECDRNRFWQIVKRYRKTEQTKTIAVRDPGGKVVHEIKDVIPVWKNHFSNLCSPKQDGMYDPTHHTNVTKKVNEWGQGNDFDAFLDTPFTNREVENVIKQLNKGKSAGVDMVTAEHLQNAGGSLINILTVIYNRIVELEFIPTNFRLGTQIPLYKGKNTCSLDPNNYRGITLLTTMNKVLEMLIWDRLKDWWYNSQDDLMCGKVYSWNDVW